MTFTALKTKVKDYCNLTSTEADTRIGNSLNAVYRRVTTSLGLDAARFVTRNASTSIGVRTVTFSSIEKIDRLIDTTDSNNIRLLTEVEIHQIRSTQPSSGAPNTWAPQNMTADGVTVVLDTLPQAVYSLQADGWASVSDLSGTDEPAFPESYHDILAWSVISEELLKKEKDKLAATYQGKAEALLSDLRFYLADSPTRETVQGITPSLSGITGGSGGTGNTGGSSYTQTGLITFDRDPAVPFAVSSGSDFVDNLIADDVHLENTDRLIGRDTAGAGTSEEITVGGGLEFTGSAGIQRSALTGDVTASAGSNATTIANSAVTDAKVSASAAIAWTKLSKSGSSLADLATRSAGDLSSGNLPVAQMPTGGTWTLSTDLTVAAKTITASAQPRCSAYNSAVQTIATASETVLTLDSEDYDVGSMHDTSSNTGRVTVPVAGVYLFNARVRRSATAMTGALLLLRKNGVSTYLGGQYIETLTAATHQVTALLTLAANDYVEMVLFCNTATSTDWGSATPQHAARLEAIKLW